MYSGRRAVRDRTRAWLRELAEVARHIEGLTRARSTISRFEAAVDAIRKAAAAAQEIVLAPLGFDDVARLIADAMHCERDRAQLVLASSRLLRPASCAQRRAPLGGSRRLGLPQEIVSAFGRRLALTFGIGLRPTPFGLNEP